MIKNRLHYLTKIFMLTYNKGVKFKRIVELMIC